MIIRPVVAGLATLLACGNPAAALTFDFTTVSGDTLTAAQAAGFQVAANVWSASLSDAITVNLQIGFSATLGFGILGETTPTIVYGQKTLIASLLAADAKDSTDAMAVTSLQSSTQQMLAVTSAEARALGATVPGSITNDGTIEFSSTYAFSTSRNADGTIAGGTYDLIGIAEHEIGHLLGFVSTIDGGTGSNQTLLDQFRYSAAGLRSVAAGAAAYFSVDSGVTHIANFSAGEVNGSGNQASHWAIGVNGVMVPEAAAGQTQNITALDLQAFDTIGYDVPEPWSLGLLAVGSVTAAGLRRRRPH